VNSLITDVPSVRAFGTLLFSRRHGTNSRGLESSAAPTQGSLVYLEQSVVKWIVFREGNRLPRRAHINPADVIGDICPCEEKHHWWCHFAMEETGYQAVSLTNCLSYPLTVFVCKGLCSTQPAFIAQSSVFLILRCRLNAQNTHANIQNAHPPVCRAFWQVAYLEEGTNGVAAPGSRVECVANWIL